MAGDRDQYPQVLDISSDEWHLRALADDGYGPTYPTVCGKYVTTRTVDEAEGEPYEWQTRCPGCFPSKG